MRFTRIAAMALALAALTACTQQRLANDQATLAGLCQAYAAAKPTLVSPGAGSKEENLQTYADAACTADGAVSSSLPAGTPPAWLQDVLVGLKVVAPIAAALI